MELLIVAVSIIVLISIISFVYIRTISKYEKTIAELVAENSKVVSHRKSSEVRLGRMAEQFAPIIKGYPYNPNKFKFLGDPIDGVQINPDSIVLIEFKTGKARLTDSQKHVKKLVQEGKVRFETFRMNEAGGSIKIEADVSESKKSKRKN
jgi:predicted Holliday junction resolvase-like endonuclease